MGNIIPNILDRIYYYESDTLSKINAIRPTPYFNKNPIDNIYLKRNLRTKTEKPTKSLSVIKEELLEESSCFNNLSSVSGSCPSCCEPTIMHEGTVPQYQRHSHQAVFIETISEATETQGSGSLVPLR